jgi:nitroreductase
MAYRGVYLYFPLKECASMSLELLSARRSIRQYTGQEVSNEEITQVLKAAMAAPSAGNEQPWEFVVVRDRAKLDRIPTFHPHALMLKHAPVAILVCGDLNREVHKGYWVQDCSAATQNLLLAVQALGLGGVWVGVYPKEERVNGFRQLLGIPEHVVPFALIPIGHPAEQKPPADRFNESRVHYDQW